MCLRKVALVAVRNIDLPDIIMRAKQNDQAAYEQLYHVYAQALFRYLYARCGNVTLAEEALGELWLRVVQYLPFFRIPEHGAERAFNSWIYTIARNLIITMSTSNRVDNLAISDDIMAPEQDLDSRIQHSDERRSLVAAMKQLTPEQREVIVLRFSEMLSSAEVANRTGRSETAVKALQHRAIATLGRLMSKQRDDDHAYLQFQPRR